MLKSVRKFRLGVMGSRLIVRVRSSPVVDLPPNLELPDLAVLEPSEPSPISPMNFLFPEKMPNTIIPVKKFLDPSSDAVGQFALDPRVFGVAIRQDIIHQMIRYQRAAKRQPQCSKRIGDIRGSTRKLYQQKGTGRHRVGQARVPGRKGGAKAHGPVLRDFSFSLNRKLRGMGLMVAIAAKYREGNLFVYDSLRCESNRTKNFTALLEKHGLLDSLTLFVDEHEDPNFSLASRNLQFVKFLLQDHVNVYDVVRRDKLAISTAGLSALQERLVSQRYYLGKKKAVLSKMEEYERLKELGSSLADDHEGTIKNNTVKE